LHELEFEVVSLGGQSRVYYVASLDEVYKPTRKAPTSSVGLTRIINRSHQVRLFFFLKINCEIGETGVSTGNIEERFQSINQRRATSNRMSLKTCMIIDCERTPRERAKI
jgi:hypothetical protein